MIKILWLRVILTVRGQLPIHDESGASLIEYAFLLVLILIVALLALKFIGGTTANSLNNSGNSLFNTP